METPHDTLKILKEFLQTAVPLWIMRFKDVPWEDLKLIMKESERILEESGELAVFAQVKQGQTAKAFNAIARAIAALSFVPGGIEIFGRHFETKYEGPAMGGGFPRGWEKKWGHLSVDAELKDEWLERMNSIPGLTVDYTCAGHPDARDDHRYPFICVVLNVDTRTMGTGEETAFMEKVENALDHNTVRRAGGAKLEWKDVKKYGEPELFFCIRSLVERDLMTDEQFSDWWEGVIGRLETLV